MDTYGQRKDILAEETVSTSSLTMEFDPNYWECVSGLKGWWVRSMRESLRSEKVSWVELVGGYPSSMAEKFCICLVSWNSHKPQVGIEKLLNMKLVRLFTFI